MSKRIRSALFAQTEEEPEVSTKDASTSTELNRQNARFENEALFCNTPVAMLQPSENLADIPKRCKIYICRSQVPPPHLLHREFTRQKFCFNGTFGYVFNYHRGEGNLYQIREDEKFTATTPPVKNDDWVVLIALIPLKDFHPKEIVESRKCHSSNLIGSHSDDFIEFVTEL